MVPNLVQFLTPFLLALVSVCSRSLAPPSSTAFLKSNSLHFGVVRACLSRRQKRKEVPFLHLFFRLEASWQKKEVLACADRFFVPAAREEGSCALLHHSALDSRTSHIPLSSCPTYVGAREPLFLLALVGKTSATRARLIPVFHPRLFDPRHLLPASIPQV